MLNGLSRRSLNVIIIGSMLLIVWINLRNSGEDATLEPLTLAPLPAQQWQLWDSSEGVPLRWQTLRSDTLTIAISGAEGYRLHLSIPAENWASALKDAAPSLPAARAAGIALQGPLSDEEMRSSAAWLIHHLQLKAPLSRAGQQCQLSYPAGAYWFNDQTNASWGTPAPVNGAALPDNAQWAGFREAATRSLRKDWLSPTRSIDIQSELAYHRWPENYLQALYQDLGSAQPDSAALYAACIHSVTGRIAH
ncbi:MAG: hypothetical protein CSH36_03430 [Thalassolituus sp.]|nr:MAG: hypothetical protein CSH36_03430 [Thalassolituus sp.]